MHRNGNTDFVKWLRAVDQAFSCRWSMQMEPVEKHIAMKHNIRAKFFKAVLGETSGKLNVELGITDIQAALVDDPSLVTHLSPMEYYGHYNGAYSISK